MKLVRFGPPGREKPGIVDASGGIRDLSNVVPDIGGDTLSPEGLAKIRSQKLEQLPLVSGTPRLGPCVGNVRHFIAIGLNYADHAAEAGQPLPKEPIIFSKAPTSICGPNDDTITPKESTKLDYEIELGIVIGSRARYLDKSKAMDAVAGYFLTNDVSERDFQISRSSGQWNKGKGCETFGPIGPWLVTKDEIPDPQALAMQLRVNGDVRQQGNTAQMRIPIPHLVAHHSAQGFSAGDLLTTGTISGVAAVQPNPFDFYLRPGDRIEAEIEHVGVLRNHVVPWSAAHDTPPYTTDLYSSPV